MIGKSPISRGAFRVRLLKPEEGRLALPLAQLLYPGLTEDAWLAYSDGRERRNPRRLLAVCNPNGYLQSLCTLTDGFDLRCGRSLDVDDLVVASFVDTKSVAQVLLNGIEEIARAGDYREVRITLADSNLPSRQVIVDALNSNGHVRTMARFAKPLMQPFRPVVGP